MSFHRFVLALVLVAGLGDAARAADPCLVAARTGNRETKSACTDAFQLAKDACVGREHGCVDVCRAQRDDCRSASGLAGALAACDAVRDTEVAYCHGTFPGGDIGLDVCIDEAQVRAFQCRDGARTDARPAMIACRTGFRNCTAACPLTGVLIDRSACLQTAVTTLKLCLQVAREDYRLEKDACRGMDHGCVEDCRDGRASCLAPVETSLDDAIAACNADRDAAIVGCAGDDACLDQAQLDGFVCRDAAREAATPGAAACRTEFRACVVGPPGCVAVGG